MWAEWNLQIAKWLISREVFWFSNSVQDSKFSFWNRINWTLNEREREKGGGEGEEKLEMQLLESKK